MSWHVVQTANKIKGILGCKKHLWHWSDSRGIQKLPICKDDQEAIRYFLQYIYSCSCFFKASMMYLLERHCLNNRPLTTPKPNDCQSVFYSSIEKQFSMEHEQQLIRPFGVCNHHNRWLASEREKLLSHTSCKFLPPTDAFLLASNHDILR